MGVMWTVLVTRPLRRGGSPGSCLCLHPRPLCCPGRLQHQCEASAAGVTSVESCTSLLCSPFFILSLLSSCELPTLELPSPESWTLGKGETQRLASPHAGQRLPQGDRIPTGQASAQAQRCQQELESWRDEVWAQGLTPLS